MSLLFLLLKADGKIYDVFPEDYGASSPAIYVTVAAIVIIIIVFIVAAIMGEINKNKK